MSEIHALQAAVAAWVAHNLPNDGPIAAALGLAEETGELARGALKQHQGIRGTYDEWAREIEKEAGDVFLKLAHIAVVCGFDLSAAIHMRWTAISTRDWVADPTGHGLPE